MSSAGLTGEAKAIVRVHRVSVLAHCYPCTASCSIQETCIKKASIHMNICVNEATKYH